VAKVWYNTYPDTQSYRDYLIYTFDVFFGNWQAIDLQESDLRALVLIFVLLTVLFPIIIMNLLIALLNEFYEDTPPNADFGIKLDMILKIIESRMLCRRLFKKKEIRKNSRRMKSCEFQWNIGNCYLYICMPAHRKRSKNNMGGNYDRAEKIYTLGKVKKLDARMDSILESTNIIKNIQERTKKLDYINKNVKD
jgi:hypothetical protein